MLQRGSVSAEPRVVPAEPALKQGQDLPLADAQLEKSITTNIAGDAAAEHAPRAILFHGQGLQGEFAGLVPHRRHDSTLLRQLPRLEELSHGATYGEASAHIGADNGLHEVLTEHVLNKSCLFQGDEVRCRLDVVGPVEHSASEVDRWNGRAEWRWPLRSVSKGERGL